MGWLWEWNSRAKSGSTPATAAPPLLDFLSPEISPSFCSRKWTVHCPLHSIRLEFYWTRQSQWSCVFPTVEHTSEVYCTCCILTEATYKVYMPSGWYADILEVNRCDVCSNTCMSAHLRQDSTQSIWNCQSKQQLYARGSASSTRETYCFFKRRYGVISCSTRSFLKVWWSRNWSAAFDVTNYHNHRRLY